MHPYVLVPLACVIASAMLAAAITAREPDRRANRLMGYILAAAGIWSLCMFVWNLAPDAAAAVAPMRISSIGSLLIGPLLLHLVLVTTEGMQRWRALVPASYVLAAAAVALALFSDGVVAGARPTAWGFEQVPGRHVGLVYAMVVAGPLVGAGAFVRQRRREPGPQPAGLRHLTTAGVLCLATGTLTDFLLPALGVAAPRLGVASLVAWGGFTWWTWYRHRAASFAPHRFAAEILDVLPHGVALVRLDGRIRSSNERLCALAARSREELLGLPLRELIPGAERLELAEAELELVGAEGQRVPVSVSRTSLRDEESNTIGDVFVVRDLRELVSLRDRLVASGRLVAVGQLAAGIAHEINNPIAYVRSNIRLLGEHWANADKALARSPLGPAGRAALDGGPERIAEAGADVDRVAAIVRDVGGFSRSGTLEPELADVVELLDRALRVAALQLRHVVVERRYAPLPALRCVPEELVQVFLNLLLNAGQALESGGTVRVSTSSDAAGVCVEIADDGPGIPAHALPQIFEPFFTTRPVGGGAGLGLALSRQIVSGHGGSIDVESRLGEGTCFRVRLPLRAGAAPPEVAP